MVLCCAVASCINLWFAHFRIAQCIAKKNAYRNKKHFTVLSSVNCVHYCMYVYFGFILPYQRREAKQAKKIIRKCV